MVRIHTINDSPSNSNTQNRITFAHALRIIRTYFPDSVQQIKDFDNAVKDGRVSVDIMQGAENVLRDISNHLNSLNEDLPGESEALIKLLTFLTERIATGEHYARQYEKSKLKLKKLETHIEKLNDTIDKLTKQIENLGQRPVAIKPIDDNVEILISTPNSFGSRRTEWYEEQVLDNLHKISSNASDKSKRISPTTIGLDKDKDVYIMARKTDKAGTIIKQHKRDG